MAINYISISLGKKNQLLFKSQSYLIYVYGCLPACMSICIPYMPGAFRGQKRVLNHLELELQITVSCHIGARIRSGASGKAVTALNC